MGDFWRSAYEDANFVNDVEIIWEQMLPLYEQLHAYVRTKLSKELYPGMVDMTSPIPAHLFGQSLLSTPRYLTDFLQLLHLMGAVLDRQPG